MKTRYNFCLLMFFHVLFGVFFLFRAPATAYTIPDTGVTSCVDMNGNMIACPAAGQPFHGQDAQYGPGSMSFTVNGDGTVSDNSTGLMWEVKSAADGAPDLQNPNDADNIYSWEELQNYIDNLNTTRFGGHADWRLPSLKELDSIIDLSVTGSATTINKPVFPNCQCASYWSGDEFADDAARAWYQDFSSGNDGYLDKANRFYVRAVRGSTTTGFIDNGDGTITDTETGLVWQKDDSSMAMSWQAGLAYAENLTLAGCSSWRLPNRKELENVIDRARSNPAADPGLFNWDPVVCWSSTPMGGSGKIWSVDLATGRKVQTPATSMAYAVAVTGGCTLDRTPPEVIDVLPASGAVDVAPDSVISVTFNEDMAPDTITSTSFTLKTGADIVPGSVTYDAGKAFFTPSSPLQPATIYRASISSAATDLAGNGLTPEYQWSFITPDSTPPAGTIIINGGAAWCSSVNVTLALPATDNSGTVAAMQLSNDNLVWTEWETYAPARAWALPTGDGDKMVYVRFRDCSGNVSTDYSDSIVLDSVAPALTLAPAISPTNKTTQIISGTTAAGATIGASVDTWGIVDCLPVIGTDWECTVTGLADGPNTITVTAEDQAGNSSSLAALIMVDRIAPEGTVRINDGSGLTNSTVVTLNLAASDDNGTVGAMQFADQDTAWTAWVPYLPQRIWTFTGDNGQKTVQVRFRDVAGNESAVAVASLVLDTVAPAVTVSSPSIFTNSSSFTITGTCEQGAVVQVLANGATVGPVSRPGATTWECTVSALPVGVSSITVVATDSAGNTGYASSEIAYDNIAPVGSVSINGGAVATGSATVTLNLSATDENSVGLLRVSNDGVSWSAWEDYTAGKTWTVAAGDGTKIVYVQFRDAAGNISEVVSDTIELDTAAPFVTVNDPVSPTRDVVQVLAGSRETGAVIVVSALESTTVVGQVSYPTASTWQCEIRLSEGTNQLTVNATDAAGNASASAATAIVLDTAAEVAIGPVASPTSGNGQSISGTREQGASVVITCATATVGVVTYPGPTDWQCQISNLTPGLNTIVVKATDTLGNTGSEVATIQVDNTPPTGTLIINGGAASTGTTAVVLAFTAVDDSGAVDSLRLSNDGLTWSAWQPYTNSLLWNLPAGEGGKTVSVQFRDAAGNQSAAFSSNIIVDTTAPDVTIDPVTSPTSDSIQLIGGGRESGAAVSVLAPAGLTVPVTYPGESTWSCMVKLQEGSNAIWVKASDAAGNSSSAGTSIVLDTRADIAIDPVASPTGKRSQTISGTREAGAPVTVGISTTAVAGTVTYPSATLWQCPVSDLAAGSNVVTVRATDSFGNTGSVQATIIVDLTPPTGTVAINNGTDSTNTTLVHLKLGAADNVSGVSSMRFSNDGVGWQAWEPYQADKAWYVPAGDGTKTVYAQFMDGAGNQSETYYDMVVLDTVAPLVAIDPVLSPTRVTTQVISGPRESGASIKISAPAGLAAQVTYPSASTWQCTVNLREGGNPVTVTGTDGAGNNAVASVSILCDTVAAVGINSLKTPTNVAGVTFTGTRESGATVQIMVNGSPVAAVLLTGSTGWQCSMVLTEGTNIIEATAIDSLGNTGNASKTVVLDTVPPMVTIDPIAGLTNLENQVISGTREDGASIMVKGPGVVVGQLGYPTATSWQCPVILSEWANVLTVTGVDAAGNSSSAAVSITLDTIADISLTAVKSPTNLASQVITGVRELNASVTVQAAGPAVAGSVAYPTATTWSSSINNMVEGANTFMVSAVDALGNMDELSGSITLDTQVPTVTIDPVVSPTNETVTTISGTRSSDGLITVAGTGIKVNGISYADQDHWSARLTLREGDNAMTVTVADAAGNSSSAVTSITLDSIAQLTLNFVKSPTNIASQLLSGTRESGAAIYVRCPEATIGMVTYPTMTTWQCPIVIGEGSNSLTVDCIDGLGNTGSKTATVVLDTLPPAVTIDPTAGLTNVPALTVTGTRDSEGTIVVSVPRATVQGVSYPSATTWKSDLVLAEGGNTITAKAVDPAGNSSTAVTVVTLDTIARVTMYPIKSPTNKAGQLLRGTREAGAGITISGVASGPVDLSQPTFWQSSITLVEGANQITVTADDGANTTSIAATVVLDTTPPLPVTVKGADTLLGGSVTLDWTSYDLDGAQGVSSYWLYADKLDFSDISHRYPATKLGPGTRTYTALGLRDNMVWYFAVVAVDAAGNFAPAVQTVQVVPTSQGIHGYVKDGISGAPLLKAVVQINDLPPVATNEEGYYVKTGLPVGTYNVNVSGTGYAESGQVVVTVASGQVARVDVALQPEAKLPAPPTDVAAQAGDGKVTISWSPVAELDLAGYALFRFIAPTDSNPVRVNPQFVQDEFYVDMDLANNTTYYYTVRSITQDGRASTDSEMVSAMPVAGPPEPAQNLEGVLNQDTTATLTWTLSPTIGVSSYAIYWDSGTGVIDYANPLATVSGLVSTWTSAALAPGTTALFGLRATKNGLEETNTGLAVSVSVPDQPSTGPAAVIKKPKAGARIAGNRMSLRAELSRGTAAEVESVAFQYRRLGVSEWTLVPAAVVTHPNPDITAPYTVHWGVEKYEEGLYELRAVAVDKSGLADPAPATVTVIVDHKKPDIMEKSDAGIEHRTRKLVQRRVMNSLVFNGSQGTGSYSVVLPADALATDTALVAEIPKDAEMADKVAGYQHVGSFLRLRLGSGQTKFVGGERVTIAMPYPDEDDDGTVDGYGFSQGLLTILWHNPATGKWEADGISNIVVDQGTKQVKANTSHFSDFAIMATGTDTDGDGLSDADEVAIYGTDPLLADTEGDGMPDGWEVTFGLNPLADDAGLDPDKDGYTNLEEYTGGTNPKVANVMGGGATVMHVPILNGWWQLISILTGCYFIRRRQRHGRK